MRIFIGQKKLNFFYEAAEFAQYSSRIFWTWRVNEEYHAKQINF